MKESLLDIIEDFNTKYDNLKRKLPYSFNLLDEVKANENAHSKILKKLLGFKEGDKYPFLKSFLESVDFDTIRSKIKEPKIYAEKDRIDISIKDEDYVIIIENKIHNAPEQKRQVDRYFEKVDKQKYKDKIFVLYLTQSGGDPSKYSLSEKIKVELDNNYKAINYRDNILPWIEQSVLPACRYQHTMLISGIEQYIDHLKGIFQIRENMKEMDEQLNKELEEKLNLNKELTLEDKVDKIDELKGGLNTFLLHLEKTKVNYLSEISKNKFNEKYKDEWQKLLNKLYPKNVISSDTDRRGYWWIGIEMKYHGKRFLCGIGYDNINEQEERHLEPYFGTTCRPDYKEKDNGVANFIKEYNDESFVKTTNWYAQKRTNFENILEEFEKYFNKIRKHDSVTAIKK